MDLLVPILLEKLGEALARAGPGEFAPGIPAAKGISPIPAVPRFGKPIDWWFVDHRHEAEKAGPHTDLRLSDGRTAFSWVVRKGIPAMPGEMVKAIRQPDHDPAYLSFEGQIPEGYGKTKGRGVWIGDQGPARILSADDDKIRFALLHHQNPRQYTMVRRGDKDWLLINTTPTPQTRPGVPQSKPKYREAPPEEFPRFLSDGSRTAVSAKIDGAHVTINLDRETPEIYSYRPSERQTGLIDHTFVAGLDRKPTPPQLRGVRARGEIHVVDRSGKPVPNRELAGILNSSPMKGINTLKERGYQVRLAPFDVITGPKGTPMEATPWREKRVVLQQLARAMGPRFRIPDTAVSASGQRELFDKIQRKEHAQTDEGVVVWRMDQAGPPTKIKIRPHRQVYIKDVLEGTGRFKGRAVRYTYSLTPGGPAVGFVGTGFNDEERDWLWKNRGRLRGQKTVIKSSEQFPSGAYRAPSHDHVHL